MDSAPVVARPLRGLVLITSAVDTVPRPTPKTRAQHAEVVAAALEAQAMLPLPFGTVMPAPAPMRGRRFGPPPNAWWSGQG